MINKRSLLRSALSVLAEGKFWTSWYNGICNEDQSNWLTSSREGEAAFVFCMCVLIPCSTAINKAIVRASVLRPHL
eukprot:831751-Amphidinium_carterae.1